MLHALSKRKAVSNTSTDRGRQGSSFLCSAKFVATKPVVCQLVVVPVDRSIVVAVRRRGCNFVKTVVATAAGKRSSAWDVSSVVNGKLLLLLQLAVAAGATLIVVPTSAGGVVKAVVSPFAKTLLPVQLHGEANITLRLKK